MIDSKTGPDSDFSRRSLVKSAASAAAVGGALVLAGPAATATAATTPGSEQAPPAGSPEHHTDTQVMVRVLDVRRGTLEVYTANGHHHTITDRPLAAQLARLGR